MLKLKLDSSITMFGLIYFWKIWKFEFALQCLYFFVIVKQRALFDKLEKTKALLFTVTEKIYIYQKMNTHFFMNRYLHQANNVMKKNLGYPLLPTLVISFLNGP